MRYRMLKEDELIHFEDELKQFLIINGVSAEDWKRLNKNEPEKAIELVRLFSESVFSQLMERITHLEHRSPKQLLLFSCEKDTINLIGLRSESPEVDFSTTDSIHKSLQSHADKIVSFRQCKPYGKKREEELFEMTERGCLKSSAVFFEAVLKMVE